MKKSIIEILKSFSSRFHEIDTLLKASVSSISREINSVDLVKALADLDKYDTKSDKISKEYEENIKNAEYIAKFAKEQVDSGFPILYANAVIAMWTSLETLIEDILYHQFINNPKYLKSEIILYIKIPLVEFEELDKDERLRFIINELARQTKSDLKHGIARFEVLLEVVALGGPVTDELRKDIFELWAVRNLLVHRFGAVDRRFKNLCPWITVGNGEQFKINMDLYFRYHKAIADYAIEILIRDMVLRGEDRVDAEARIKGKNKNNGTV